MAQPDLARLVEQSEKRVAELRAQAADAPLSPAALELFDVLSGECRWPEADAHVARMCAAVLGRPDAWTRPFRFLLYRDDPALHLELARRFSRIHAAPSLPAAARPRSARIRIGYVSNNLNQHPMARWISELIELHDRSRFEIVAVDWSKEDGSPERARLRAAFDRIVDVSGTTDADAAARIRAEGIDVTIDLAGHTLESRPGILAPHPAPAQATFIGFPGSSGAPWIDYIIGDPWVTPFRHSNGFSEKIAQLPFSYQPNDRKRKVAGARFPRRAYGLPEGAFVYCCTNHAHKITAEMFAVWLRILARVPGSVLWLWVESPVGQRNLRALAQGQGVAPDRLVFAPGMENADHLARLAHADLFLDTLPYNAHSSASDALWVGVPVLTMPGRSFHARVAASILAAAELPDLICRDLGEYEEIAVRLATNPELIKGIRDRVAANRSNAPIFDTPRYARYLEAAYIAMHERASRGEPAAHLRIEATLPPGVEATAIDVQTAERFNQRGIEMADARRFVEAEALLRQAIALQPTFAKAYNNLGNVLDELGESADSEAAYRKAVEIAPDYRIAQENLLAHLKARPA